jgi:hypothetical protein
VNPENPGIVELGGEAVEFGGEPLYIPTLLKKPKDANRDNQRITVLNPSDELKAAYLAGYARVIRFMDIFEADNVTPWRRNAPIVDGSVAVDYGREERRVLEVQAGSETTNLPFGPGQLWYDKVLKPYRGLTMDGIDYVTPLGEFMPDRIERTSDSSVVALAARDFTKKLEKSKLPDTTSFSAGLALETVLRSLAINAGVDPTRINFEATGITLAREAVFEKLTPRRDAMKEIASGYGYELFFAKHGELILRPFVDPHTAEISHEFTTGPTGNISSFRRSADDSRLYNEVIVYGTAQENGLVWGKAENTAPGSPTSIDNLGSRRTMDFPSEVVPDNTYATNLAQTLLSVSALEQYDAGIDAAVAPWIEAGEAALFVPDDLAAGEPTRYLLVNFTIPLGLGLMPANVKRVHLVG